MTTMTRLPIEASDAPLAGSEPLSATQYLGHLRGHELPRLSELGLRVHPGVFGFDQDPLTQLRPGHPGAMRLGFWDWHPDQCWLQAADAQDFSMARNLRMTSRALAPHVRLRFALEGIPLAEYRSWDRQREAQHARGFLDQVEAVWSYIHMGCDMVLDARVAGGTSSAPLLFCPVGNPAFGWERPLAPGWQTNDLLLVTSRAQEEAIARTVGHLALPIARHPWCVDCEVFRPRPERREAVRSALDIPPTVPLLLYAGRLAPEKNLHHVLRLLARLRESSDTHLVVAGPASDVGLFQFLDWPARRYLTWLLDQAAQADLLDAIRWVAPVLEEQDMTALYSAADLFISFSTAMGETVGLALVEAAACGLPTLASDWGGFRDVVLDGETGVLVPTLPLGYGAVPLWPQRLEQIWQLLLNPSARWQMSQTARRVARERFDLDVIARHHTELLASCCSEPARPALSFAHPRYLSIQKAPEPDERRLEPLQPRRSLALHRYLNAPWPSLPTAAADEEWRLLADLGPLRRDGEEFWWDDPVLPRRWGPDEPTR